MLLVSILRQVLVSYAMFVGSRSVGLQQSGGQAYDSDSIRRRQREQSKEMSQTSRQWRLRDLHIREYAL